MSKYSLNAKQFIWTIDKSLSGATNPGLSGPGRDGKGGLLCISQTFNITGAYHIVKSDMLESYPSAEKQSVYSIAPTDWASKKKSPDSWKNYGWWVGDQKNVANLTSQVSELLQCHPGNMKSDIFMKHCNDKD